MGSPHNASRFVQSLHASRHRATTMTIELDESRPIPDTKDGFLYYSWPAGSTDHLTIEDVKACADAQPWGPVIWDDKNLPFELKDKLLRELATRESLKLLPMALDVLIRLRMARATPEQIGLVLRFATALTRAKSEEELHRAISLIILEEKGAAQPDELAWLRG